jgi:A/G-specific adenine glycosylase
MKPSPHFHTAIRAWYAAHGRAELPWRRTSDAYAIYISEVMLQQTQVQTVLARYYFPFLIRFPTLQALAEADVEEVLKAWEGLGYYTRARNLHRAAQIAAPALPDSVEALMALPGIGRNTAHAICAFAYHQPVAIMEANVKRVLHRLTAHTQMSDKELWVLADALMDRAHPYDYNQAIMDIGATICTPTSPACGICPLMDACAGRGDPLAYPQKRVKKVIPVRLKRILVCEVNKRFFATPRTGALLGGLYGFPEYEREGEMLFQGKPCEGVLTLLGEIEQTYSHFRLKAQVYHKSGDLADMTDIRDWHTREEMALLPLSGADHKVLRLL